MKKYNVLYIDDEPANLRVFKNTFKWNFNVVTTESSSEGYKYISNHIDDIDVIITDQRMPELTGLELLDKISDIKPELSQRCILLSGYTDQEKVATALSSKKMYTYVNKPWDPESLKTLIDQVINQA